MRNLIRSLFLHLGGTMSATYLALQTLAAPTTLPGRTAAAAPIKSCVFSYSKSLRKNSFSTGRCKASSSSSSSITDFDLYDLLGIDSSSTQSQIKLAYRSLQKRCHPDIAGPTGHDMSIILNEAYALLSDPTSRFAYDKEQAKLCDVRGYTGRPLYSVWAGSEEEERAVFVDEVTCVGCLKCALLAGKTFAIESSFGRARVVAQWADPETKIQEAIDSCPVDCISMVERSELAALEFLMSKQPRGNVTVGAGNTVGSNIFAELHKFQTKVKEAAEGRGDDLQREAKMAAINAIRSISNWLYWDSPVGGTTRSDYLTRQSQTRPASADEHPTMKKLRDAAAARRRLQPQSLLASTPTSEYWPLPTINSSSPGVVVPPTAPPATSSSSSSISDDLQENTEVSANSPRNREFSPIRSGIPLIMAAIAVAVVKFNSVSAEALGGGVEDHIGGSLALQIVNSSWLQVALAGATWFYIGTALVELIAVMGATNDATKSRKP